MSSLVGELDLAHYKKYIIGLLRCTCVCARCSFFLIMHHQCSIVFSSTFFISLKAGSGVAIIVAASATSAFARLSFQALGLLPTFLMWLPYLRSTPDISPSLPSLFCPSPMVIAVLVLGLVCCCQEWLALGQGKGLQRRGSSFQNLALRNVSMLCP